MWLRLREFRAVLVENKTDARLDPPQQVGACAEGASFRVRAEEIRSAKHYLPGLQGRQHGLANSCISLSESLLPLGPKKREYVRAILHKGKTKRISERSLLRGGARAGRPKASSLADRLPTSRVLPRC